MADKPSTEITIRLRGPENSDSAKALLSVLEAIQRLGDIGASRSIVIEEGNDDGTDQNVAYWDGDGADRIEDITVKVAARFQRADARERARKLTTPINAPRGIAQSIVDQNGSPMEPGHDDVLDPSGTDIQPKDVFNLTPNNGGVLNLAQTGKDLQNAVQTKVPRDEGYGTVYNLSQYLIRTDGGGDSGPAGSQ